MLATISLAVDLPLVRAVPGIFGLSANSASSFAAGITVPVTHCVRATATCTEPLWSVRHALCRMHRIEEGLCCEVPAMLRRVVPSVLHVKLALMFHREGATCFLNGDAPVAADAVGG